MEAELSAHHRKTYQHVFAHPMPGNLDFKDVLALLKAIPDVVVAEEPDGHVKAARGGRTLTLRRPKGKDFSDKAEITHLRHFLDESRTPTPAAATAAEERATAGTHLLVVIDHHGAKVFAAEMHGAKPAEVRPYDPFGFRRELHEDETDGSGKREPELKSYYDQVARTLAKAEAVLLFGSGTGAANAAEALLAELKHHHPAIAAKVVGTVKVDQHAMTDDQLLAKAREHFGGR